MVVPLLCSACRPSTCARYSAREWPARICDHELCQLWRMGVQGAKAPCRQRLEAAFPTKNTQQGIKGHAFTYDIRTCVPLSHSVSRRRLAYTCAYIYVGIHQHVQCMYTYVRANYSGRLQASPARPPPKLVGARLYRRASLLLTSVINY